MKPAKFHGIKREDATLLKNAGQASAKGFMGVCFAFFQASRLICPAERSHFYEKKLWGFR
jgi:hypothetical protein